MQVILDTDGTLHAMSIDRRCQYHVDIGETSLVGLVSHDLLPAIPGVELLVATSDGTLLCLLAGNVTASQSSAANQMSSSELRELSRVTAWPAELRAHNDFVFSDSVSAVCDTTVHSLSVCLSVCLLVSLCPALVSTGQWCLTSLDHTQ